jgi:C-terminal peptidase prc
VPAAESFRGKSPSRSRRLARASESNRMHVGRNRRSLTLLLFLLGAPFLSPPYAHASSAAQRAAIESGLRIVEANYLFQEELDVGRLLGSALEAIEAAIPRAHAFEVRPTAYVIETGDCRLHLEIAPDAVLTDLAAPFAAAADLIEQCVTDPPDDMPTPAALLLGGMLSGLDPYSSVFDSRGRREHTIQFRGKLAGIGARIGTRSDTLTLITVYSDSPAARAGLRNKDRVLRIDGVSTLNMPVGDAVERIRGDVGTQVVLTIGRDDATEAVEITVTRGLVLIPSVEAKVLPSGNIYALISHFSQTTPEDFLDHVVELLGDDPKRGVIIDLRANSGGSMLGSSAIADAFLSEGLLITTAGRDGRNVAGLTGSVHATPTTPLRDCPVAILTSPRTASGSELMSASLRNHDRAVFIGQPTFGKGTVQKTYPLGAEEGLKLTVGNFLPKGLAIPTEGLVPDVEIRTLAKTTDSFRTSIRDDLDDDERKFWQRNPAWLTEEEPRTPVVLPFYRDVSDDESEEPEDDDNLLEDPAADPAVSVADDLLHFHGSTSARRMLDSSSEFLRERAARAQADVARVMTELGYDWQRPADETASAGVVPALTVEWNPEQRTLRAGEAAEIEIRVRNESNVPVHRLRAIVDSNVGFLRGLVLPIGRLDAGGSASGRLRIEPPRELHLARFAAEIVLETEGGKLDTFGPFFIHIDEGARPILAHRTSVTRGAEEDVLELRVELKNRGTTAAGEIRLQLVQPEIGSAELLEGSTTFKDLAPDATVETRLHVKLLDRAAEAKAVELMIFESDHRIFVKSEIALAEGSGAWREPPQISLDRVEHDGSDDADPAYGLVAIVSDDTGLVEVRTAVDGDRIGFFDLSADPTRTRRVVLPWSPAPEPKRYEIIATDRDGLVARYVTDL